MGFLTNDDIDFNRYMNETEAREKVRPASEYFDAVMHRLYPANDGTSGKECPSQTVFWIFVQGR